MKKFISLFILLPSAFILSACDSTQGGSTAGVIVENVLLPYGVSKFVENNPDKRPMLQGLSSAIRGINTNLAPEAVEAALAAYLADEIDNPADRAAVRGIAAIVLQAYGTVWDANGGNLLPGEYRAVLVKMADIIDQGLLWTPASGSHEGEELKAGRVILRFA